MNINSIALSLPLDPPRAGEGTIAEMQSYEINSLPACDEARRGINLNKFCMIIKWFLRVF